MTGLESTRRLMIVCAVMAPFFLPVAAHAVEIEEVTGPKSHVTAWLVEDHHLPIVAMHFAFLGGSEQDPATSKALKT